MYFLLKFTGFSESGLVSAFSQMPPCSPPPSLFFTLVSSSSSHGVNKLVHKSLRYVRLADDALLVVLAYGST